MDVFLFLVNWLTSSNALLYVGVAVLALERMFPSTVGRVLDLARKVLRVSPATASPPAVEPATPPVPAVEPPALTPGEHPLIDLALRLLKGVAKAKYPTLGEAEALVQYAATEAHYSYVPPPTDTAA